MDWPNESGANAERRMGVPCSLLESSVSLDRVQNRALQGLPQNVTAGIAQTRDGFLWLRFDHGLIRFDGKKFAVGRDIQANIELPADAYSLLLGSSGELWISSWKAMYCRLPNGEFRRFGNKDGVPEDPLEPLFLDKEGILWVGTENSLPIQVLMADSHGMIWASVTGGGLFRFEPDSDQVSQLPPENGRSILNIQQIYEDREGNIWLATSDGLERLSDVNFITYTARDGLPSDNVGTVTAGNSGRIWIGTSRGLACLRNGKVERISWESKDEPVLPMEVTSLYEDPKEALWFGTRDGILHRLENGQHQPVANLNTESGPGYAMGICSSRTGDLLVGTAGAGLQVFRNGQIIKTFTPADGLHNRTIFSVTIDREQTVWIGETPGVDVLRDGKISVPGGNAEMLSKTTILSTYADPDGTLWAGGVTGLYRLKDGKWAPVDFQPDERVLGPEFYCLLEDDNGNLWSSGSRGIFCVSKHELNDFSDGKRSSVNCRAFGKADGLKSPDCSNVYFPSGCRSSDGRLWFATIAGLAVIDPNHIQLNSLPPPVQIEQVVVDLFHVFPVRPGNQSVELGPGAHHLEFDYAD